MSGANNNNKEEGAEPELSADVKRMEEQSQYMVARVMSATDRRVARLNQGDSRASSANPTRPQSAADIAKAKKDEWSWTRSKQLVAVVMKLWRLGPTWKHCLKAVGVDGTGYVIEALYSVPTRRRPIPNATASVFFTVDPGPDGFEAPREQVAPGSYEATDDVDTEEPARVVIEPLPEADMQNQAKHVVSKVLDATDALISSIIEDPSRPGSSLMDQLAGVDLTYTLEQQQLVHQPDTVFKEQWLDDLLEAKRLLFKTGATVLGNEDPLAR